MGRALYRRIAAVLEADPRRVVIRADQRVVTAREMLDTVSQFATEIASMRIAPGRCVAVQVDKSPEALMLYLACLGGGWIYVPLDPQLPQVQLEQVLADADAALIIGDQARRETSESLGRAGLVRCAAHLGGPGAGGLRRSVATSAIAKSPDPAAPFPNDGAGADLAALLYTSGTTDRPKGVGLTSARLLANAEALSRAWGFSANDVLLHALPLFHVHGLFVAANTALISGAALLWQERFDAAVVAQTLRAATVMMGVPTYYQRLLDLAEFGRRQVAGMRLFISGSAALSAELHRRFEQRTGYSILERYGMTEILIHTSNPLDGERRPGTVGVALPSAQIRIVDSQENELAAGAVGQVQVKGLGVFDGYWGAEAQTAQSFTRGGWFKTGDLGQLSSDGYLTLCGRTKDLVITGGVNVSPAAVEAMICEIDGVAGCAVVGLPHRDWGEAVTAVVVLLPGSALTAEQLLQSVKRKAAAHQVPKRVLIVERLPRNAMGKIQKRVLRQQLKHLYDSSG